MNNVSRLSVVGAIIGVICLAIAAAILIAPEANDRVALVFGVIGIALPAFISQLKADQAAGNTNGKLDARIRQGVHEALNDRAHGITTEKVTPPVTPTPDGS